MYLYYFYLFVINDVQKILEISNNLAPQHWITFLWYLTREDSPHLSLAETSLVPTSSPETVPRAILSASFNTTMETWKKIKSAIVGPGDAVPLGLPIR